VRLNRPFVDFAVQNANTEATVVANDQRTPSFVKGEGVQPVNSFGHRGSHSLSTTWLEFTKLIGNLDVRSSDTDM